MKKNVFLLLCLLINVLCVGAAKPMKPIKGGKAISDQLIGIFFEDLSSAADGGLNAELVQNGSFEYSPTERDGWGAGTAWRLMKHGHSLGYMTPQQRMAGGNSSTYMQIHVERVGHYYDYNGWTGVGLMNTGFDGIPVKKDAKYDCSLRILNNTGGAKRVRILLTEQKGRWETKVLAEDSVVVEESNIWQQPKVVLTATEESNRAALQVIVLDKGDVFVDDISLLPQDTYKGHGLRRDLAEALEAMNPKFMRFPGGCVVHGGGDGMWDTYRWKNTIGPKWERKQMKNTWGYHQSMALGYYEYFQLCEDMSMEPVPILPCGVSCQGAGGGWGMKGHAQDAVPMEEMDEWTQDVLDLIEWANGDPNTSKWAKMRAEAGHPKPFNLKYVGLGNEEYISEAFIERFKYMYERVTKAHPEIIIIGTAGPGSHPGNGDYKRAWKLAEEIGLPIIDEHYYEKREYFMTSRQYDSYPRDRKTKVYLGEYAAKDKKLIDALAEALYLMHVEKNGDVVCMTSYAPLFARKNATSWNPDLIYFDNEKVYLTCSYYVQQLFGKSSGQYYYGDCVKIAEGSNKQGQSVILNVNTRKLYVKLCNASDTTKQADIDLSRFPLKGKATVTTISGQAEDENNYEQHPVVPKQDAVKTKKKFSVELAPYSLVMFEYEM